MWWAESRCWALGVLVWCGTEHREGNERLWWGWRGQELTPRRLRLSRRCRGTTVTISISQRKATSIGVRPACRGNAMVVGEVCVSWWKVDAV